MLSVDVVLLVALAYVALLFVVAFLGDRRARAGHLWWVKSPITYTLSISVYCTSWTYYGAVGSAARNGMEFVAIYLGPTLMFVGWWVLLRKLVRIGHIQRITSIADMISSRYGKSAGLAALVTVIAVAACTPYIALQLQAVVASFEVVSGSRPTASTVLSGARPNFQIAFWIAAGMAFFTILFGTRNIDANERHPGVVAAIALEAVVKLVAMLVVGILVVFGIAGGPQEIFDRMPADMSGSQGFGPTWITQLLLAAVAVVCLPRQFQVTVVEIMDERHLRTAAWLFPLYLLLISLFVLPIAIAGLSYLPKDADPDMFMLTLPMWVGREEIALFAFLGGFSAATSMIILAAIALSTMISNHLILPIALRLPYFASNPHADARRLTLNSRRVSICLLLLLAFEYFRLTARFTPLASLGLIAFAGAAQLMPSLVGGLFWRQGTVRGAAVGLSAGALLWAYTLLLPSFQGEFLLSSSDISDGLFGQRWLRPQALFGLEGFDPLVHSVFWSLAINTLLYIMVSLWREPTPMERLQSALFVDVFRSGASERARFVSRSAATEDLNLLAQRMIGVDEARQLFGSTERGLPSGADTIADDTLITGLERKLAGSFGAASAHSMVSKVVTGEHISMSELLRIADETQRVRDYSRQLEDQSRKLLVAAAELRAANELLTRLDTQKDDFLSQISHEVRTPMSSIRSFSEILLDTPDLRRTEVDRFLHIIHEESIRMTRLLDDILDLSTLERGDAPWTLTSTDPEVAMDNAIRICRGLVPHGDLHLVRERGARDVRVQADGDRLIQVFINLISNAIKYNDSPNPVLRVESSIRDHTYEVLVADNGPGIHGEAREQIFSKFSRKWARPHTARQGAGLGLAISWQIMRRLGGSLELLPENGQGACFRITLRRTRSVVAGEA